MSREHKTVEVTQRRDREVIVCDGCGKEAPIPIEYGGMPPAFTQYPMDWFRIGHGVDVRDACSSNCAANVLATIERAELAVK